MINVVGYTQPDIVSGVSLYGMRSPSNCLHPGCVEHFSG